MQRFSILLGSALCLAALVGGCATDDQAGDMVAADTSGIQYTGDFSGPLGVQLWSVRNEMKQDVPGTLAKVKALGFDQVELAGTYGMTAEQFRQELDNAGLDAAAMHVGYNIWRDSLDKVLAEAEALGAEYVGTASIPHEAPFTVENARQTAADFNKWGQAAKERGLQFFYHLHGFEFQPDAAGVLPFDVLLSETDPNNVVFEMDVFWATRPGQDPVALLQKYPNRWKLMHIKDMKPGTATNDHSGRANADSTEVPVGQGMIDYASVLRTARDVGVEYFFIEDETSDPLTAMPQSIDYLKTVRYAEAP